MNTVQVSNSIQESLYNSHVYCVYMTSRDHYDMAEDDLCQARRKFYETGQKPLKINKTGLYKGYAVKLKGRLSKKNLSWKKNCGKILLQESFDTGFGKMIQERDFDNVVTRKVYFDKSQHWTKSEYFDPADALNAVITLKPGKDSNVIERFDYDLHIGKTVLTLLHPVPYLQDTAEQSLLNARFGQPDVIVATDRGFFCYASEEESRKRSESLKQIQDGTIIMMPAWEVREGEIAGESSEENRSVPQIQFSSIEEYAKITPQASEAPKPISAAEDSTLLEDTFLPEVTQELFGESHSSAPHDMTYLDPEGQAAPQKAVSQAPQMDHPAFNQITPQKDPSYDRPSSLDEAAIEDRSRYTSPDTTDSPADSPLHFELNRTEAASPPASSTDETNLPSVSAGEASSFASVSDTDKLTVSEEVHPHTKSPLPYDDRLSKSILAAATKKIYREDAASAEASASIEQTALPFENADEPAESDAAPVVTAPESVSTVDAPLPKPSSQPIAAASPTAAAEPASEALNAAAPSGTMSDVSLTALPPPTVGPIQPEAAPSPTQDSDSETLDGTMSENEREIVKQMLHPPIADTPAPAAPLSPQPEAVAPAPNVQQEETVTEADQILGAAKKIQSDAVIDRTFNAPPIHDSSYPAGHSAEYPAASDTKVRPGGIVDSPEAPSSQDAYPDPHMIDPSARLTHDIPRDAVNAAISALAGEKLDVEIHEIIAAANKAAVSSRDMLPDASETLTSAPMSENTSTTSVVTGHGRTAQANGLTAYEGGYMNGKRDGFGSYYYKDGNLCYAGFWKDDKRDGLGVSYRNSDHALHVSSWKKNHPGTFATLFDKTGNLKFGGRIINGKKQGVGFSYNEKDGTVFVGKWVDDKQTGHGSKFDAQGNLLYTGQWKNGIREGSGISFDRYGDIVFSGEWRNDKQYSGILYKKEELYDGE